MSDSVSIPIERAKDIARWLRSFDLSVPPQNTPMPEWAELLDPKPPTLLDRVTEQIATDGEPTLGDWHTARRVLTAVANDIETLSSGGIHGSTPHYRAAVLARLRGES